MANHLAMAALLEPDDEVLIEEPAYEALLAVANYLGAKIRRFPRRFEDGFKLDPREVERAISPRTRLIVVTNLHNPTGVRTPDSTLEARRRHRAQPRRACSQSMRSISRPASIRPGNRHFISDRISLPRAA